MLFRSRRRPDLLQPVDGTAAELQQVTSGLYYLGDEIHLNNAGYGLYDESVELWLLQDMGLIGTGRFNSRMRRFPEGSNRMLGVSRFG